MADNEQININSENVEANKQYGQNDNEEQKVITKQEFKILTNELDKTNNQIIEIQQNLRRSNNETERQKFREISTKLLNKHNQINKLYNEFFQKNNKNYKLFREELQKILSINIEPLINEQQTNESPQQPNNEQQSFFQKHKIAIIIGVAISSIIIVVIIVVSVVLSRKNKQTDTTEPNISQIDEPQYNQYEDPQYKEHYEELEDDTKSDKKKSIKKSIKIPKDKITSFFTQKHNNQYDKEQNIDKQYEPVKEETIKDNNTHVSTLTDNSCNNAPCLCSETNVYLNSYINNSF